MQNLQIDGIRYTIYVNLKTKIFVKKEGDLELDVDETLKANQISLKTSDGQYHDIRDKLLDEFRDIDNRAVLQLFMRMCEQKWEPIIQPKNPPGGILRPSHFYSESATQEEIEQIYRDLQKQ